MQKRLALLAALSFLAVVSAHSFRRAGVALDAEPPRSFPRNFATIADVLVEAPNAAFVPDAADAVEYASVFIGNVVNEIESEPPVSITPIVARVTARSEELARQNFELKRELAEARSAIEAPPTTAPRRPVPVEEELVSVSVPARMRAASPALQPVAPVSILPSFESEELEIQKAVPVPVASVSPLHEIERYVFAESMEAEVTAIEPVGFTPSIPVRISPPVDDEPFGVMVSALLPDEINTVPRQNSVTLVASDGEVGMPSASGSFIRAFSAIRPERSPERASPSQAQRTVPAERHMSELSSRMLMQELQNIYISENEYLSPVEFVPNMGSRADEALHRAPDRRAVETKLDEARRRIDLPSGPLKIGNREVLQMKLDFEPSSAAISGESVNIIRSFAQVAVDQPTNSIEIGIASSAMNNSAKKRLTARRLAIVSNILRNSGLSDRQISPVLTDRDEDSFSFRAVSNDRFERVNVSRGVDMFGEADSVQSYDLMRW